MSHTPYKFTLHFGLAGCYMPDNSQVYCCYTRKEFVSLLEDELGHADWPASAFNQFKVKRTWNNVQRYKSGSSVHTSAYHGANCISVNGMTDDEYDRWMED